MSVRLPDFSAGAPLFLIAGPCAVESEKMIMETAAALKEMCEARRLPLIFKSSFDKANRTSAAASRGAGMAEGLKILAAAKREYSLPILTDVHLPQQAAETAETADVLQIPAFLCRQTDLIAACAATGKPLNIKKGQFLAPEDMLHVAAKAKAAGAAQVLLCERGACFGYHNLVADMRALEVMRAAACPVVFDATHAAQLPGADGAQSGGMRGMIPPLARAAAGAGIDGIFIETHPSPADAVSDSATQWPLAEMPRLLDSVLAIDAARRACA
ncbi:MAG: 3-deoxy-8-phosphooctulonate synthase [Gammaproteobacteria bacterium]